MKKMLIVVMMLFTSSVFSSEIELKLLTSTFLTDDDNFSRGNANGIELSYSPNDKGYFFLSRESVVVQPIYKGFNYDISGIGVGSKINITNNISVFSQVGYYLIENSIGTRREGREEWVEYYLNNRFANATGASHKAFDAYGVDNDNAYGVSIGLEFLYLMSNGYSITSTISYRLMKFDQTIKGFRYDWDKTPNSWWQSTSTQDFSSLNIGVGVKF